MKGSRQGFVRAVLFLSAAGAVVACSGGSGDANAVDTRGDPGVQAEGVADDEILDTASVDADLLASPEDTEPVGPKVEVLPLVIEFWGVKVGTAGGIEVRIGSAGTEAAVVTGIAVVPLDGATGFGLYLGGLPGGVAPTVAHPMSLETGAGVTLRVTFTPDMTSLRDAAGQYIRDRATLKVTLAQGASVEIPLSGFGVASLCPQPVLDMAEVGPVLPQAVIHLDGHRSVAVGGPLVSQVWSVEQPAQNRFLLIPGKTDLDVTHEANVAGDYRYRLDVCDANLCSDDPACGTTVFQELKAAPTQTIHCELTWDTPDDTDQFDEGPGMGADLDFHFADSFAQGPDLDGDGLPDGWFDIPYDTFWYNKNPEWAVPNPNINDNPSLDRDDTDGSGPENLNLMIPQADHVYRIGVHYWDDHGFGASFPRVRCFIEGTLALDVRLENGGIGMAKCDLWEAAAIEWPAKVAKAVTRQDGSPKVTPRYMNDAFVVVGGQFCP